MGLESALAEWKSATTELPWGVQRVLLETLETVKDGDVHLVHGSNYRDGKPCLINAVAVMVSKNAVSPMTFAPEVVANFDRINQYLREKGINDDSGYVSPLAAEILIRNFGALKPVPEDAPKTETGMVYIEKSDADFEAWIDAMTAPGPEELDSPPVDPIDEFNKSYIKGEK